LKLLAGNPGHRPLNLSEPQPTGIPTCPRHLDKCAREEWKRVSTQLIKLGLLTNIDKVVLEIYCSSYSRYREAERQIAAFGLVIKAGKSGYPIPNPYVGIANVAQETCRKCCVEFGMTPSSRSKVQGAPQQGAGAASPFARFVA
jgi:P27 family predicted phage terminase small subunit